MKTYLSVYRKFLETSLAVQMSFRTSFVLIILMDIAFYATTFFSVDFIYDHVAHIGGWNREQLLFFVSFMLCLDNLHMIIVSQNFWELTRMLRSGDMDFVLLRPLSSLFSSFFRYFRGASLVNTPISQFLTYYFAFKLELPWTSIIMIPFLQITGFVLMVSLEIIISTAGFWLTEGHGINFLRMQFQNMAEWPHFIYQGTTRMFFLWCFPILVTGSAPASILYGHNPVEWAIRLVGVTLAFTFVARKVWLFGVKHYDSASS